ncbi:MAG TPA: hypothetical protein VGM31_20800 [Puia sp.]
MKNTILSWGILALALTSFAPMVRAQQNGSRPTTTGHSGSTTWSNRQYLSIDVDSSTSPPQIIATLKNDSLYNMIISQGRLTSLYVNGKLIPAESLSGYDYLAKTIVDQMRRDSLQAIRDREQAGRDMEQAGRDREQAKRDEEQSLRDKKQAEREAIDARSEADRERTGADQDREQDVRDKKQAMRDDEQAVRDKKQAMRDGEQAIRDKKQAELDMQQAVRDKKQMEEDRALVESLKADVVKEGLAPDEKSIASLILNDSEFLVNGKKQSDEMQQKFKAKYIRRKGFGFYIHGKVTQIGQMD